MFVLQRREKYFWEAKPFDYIQYSPRNSDSTNQLTVLLYDRDSKARSDWLISGP